MAFSNNNSTTTRQNLTLRISFDEGDSWTKNILVDYDGSSTAYSDLVMIGDTKIGILYERCGTTEIAFMVIDWQ
ncbi:MAG: exo-alpha-sialidase [Sphingobacteriales bacterium]|nr:exo-alpha-sialidase [Sphingobacteriales bacterium]